MSRPNQMVTVGSGKERFSGPPILSRLHQGSQARAQAIEAAREAELARKARPIADLTSGEITKRKLRKLGLVAGGTAGLVTLQEVKTTPTQPANSPVATETIAPTPTPSPEPSPTQEPTE